MVEDIHVDVNYYYDPELRKICINCNLIKPYIEFFWSICKKHHITFSETYDKDNFAYNRKILENLRADDLEYIDTRIHKLIIGHIYMKQIMYVIRIILKNMSATQHSL